MGLKFKFSGKQPDYALVLSGCRFGGSNAHARFTEEQTVAITREVDREPGWVVAKRHGISERTIYTWRRRFGRFQVVMSGA
jgi:hypothetical protein